MPLSLDGTGLITGISTFSFSDDLVHVGDDNTKISFPANDTISFETAGTEKVRITSGGQLNVGSNIKLGTAGVVTATTFSGSGASLTSIPAGNLTGTVADARITTLTASKLSGALPAISGANLTNLPPSAPVGGATTNQVFFENDKLVEVNYQITSTKNAMTAGPISVSAGIAVTVPSGCSWTIV